MITRLRWSKNALFAMLVVALPLSIHTYAQEEDEEEVFELSPFTIDASEEEGYLATTTLAGSRVRSNLRDLGASISVVTQDFLEDTGATDGQSLLQFIGNVEVGGVLGNFSDVNINNASTNNTRINPQNSQRVRGLVNATLTRDYFNTNIPFDSYNTTRVTVNRGPNSILFGLGSPGGVINNTTKRATLGDDFGELSVRFSHRGGHRETLDYNKTLIRDRLAVRVAMLNEQIQYRQEPANEDDKRFFFAWDAVLFENERSSIIGNTIFRGSLESGSIRSNPPDVAPPRDGFSSWFEGIGDQDYLNRLLTVPGVSLANIPNAAVTKQQVLNAINTGLATVPAGSTADAYATAEGRFVPKTTIQRFLRGRDTFAGGNGGRDLIQSTTPYFLFPAINFNSITTLEPGWRDPALAGIQGIMGRWRESSGTKDLQWTSPATAGPGFRPKSLTLREVFDYHKVLLQGTTNYVDTDFEIRQFVLEQELLDGRAGFEIAWDEQTRDRTRFTPFSAGNNKTIHLDVTQNHAPGDANDDGVPDGFANENLGRPVLDWDANNTTYEKHGQETFRATFYGSLDFADMVGGTFGKILGSHTLTGLYEDRTNDAWSKNVRGSWWADTGLWPGSGAVSNGLSDNFRRIVKSQIYLGPSVLDANRPNEVRLDGGIQVPFPKIGENYGIWYFNNMNSVDAGEKNTWRIIENISSANISQTQLESTAFNLQSLFLDGHIVTNLATRNDKQTVYQRLQETVDYGDPASGERPLRLDLPGINEVDGTFNEGLLQLEDMPASFADDDTVTWSVVGRYPEVWLGDLPWGMDLTAHYYEAESFEPGGISNNVLNQPLPSPFGTTEEYGFTLSLWENRLSIRVNFFETVNAAARTGNMNGQLGQVVGRFNFFLTRIADQEDSGGSLFPTHPDHVGLTPFTVPTNRTRNTGTDADLIPGINSFDDYYNALLDLIPPQVQSVYNYRVNRLESGTVNIESTPIRGLNSTQDYVATGTEVDINGRITDNLSIQLNVAQQETVTSNTGPVAIPLAFEIESRILANFPGLDWGWWAIRDSPFQGESGTLGTRYAAVMREMRLQAARDNTVSQEQREWRINLTSRYDFTEGLFKGFSIGGSLRYQDEIAAGYPNLLDEFGNIVPDIANPWLGPDSLDGDLFLRYSRSIFDDKVGWRVQLNARNFYRKSGSKDIPITIDPDGTVSTVRIPVEQQFFLTNTFSF